MFRVSHALAAALALLLAACQGSETVSLEEAKSLTVDLAQRTASPPPPRRSTDILEQLDRAAGPSASTNDPKYDVSDSDGVLDLGRDRRIIRETPPVGASNGTLAEFYFRRGRAAGRMGRSSQMLADVREAVRLLDQGASLDWTVERRMLRRAAYLELQVGNFRRAVEIMERTVGTRRRSVWNSQLLTQLLAFAGDLNRAKVHAATVRRMMANPSRSDPPSRANVPLVDYWIADAEGRWEEAVASMTRALDIYEFDSESSAFVPSMRLFLADTLAKSGRLVDAERQLRSALERFLRLGGRDYAETARTVTRIAAVRAEQGQLEDGILLLDAADAILQRVDVPPESLARADSRRVRAQLQMLQGRWAAAATTFDALKEGLGENAFLSDKLYGRQPDAQLALVKAGRAATALPLLRETLAYLDDSFGAGHPVTAETRAILAIALAETGDLRSAIAELATALPTLLSATAAADGASETSLRGVRRRAILEGALDLLHDAGDALMADRVGTSFTIANHLRLQATQQAIADGAARAALPDPELADLARREQDARGRVTALETTLADQLLAPADQRDADVLETLRRDIARLRSARATLRAEIAERFPTYAELTEPKPITPGAASAALQPGEALVMTYTTDRRTYLWALAPSRSPVFAASPLGRADLSQQVDRLRAAVDPAGVTTLDDVPDFDVVVAHNLYKRVLEPVEAIWRPADRLLIVTGGALGYLPFSLMPTEPATLGADSSILFDRYRAVQWLARSHAVSYLPSASALAALRASRIRRSPGRAFVGFGDPVFRPRPPKAETKVAAVADFEWEARGFRGLPLPRRSLVATAGSASAGLASLPPLPETAEEIRSIAQTLGADPDRDIFLGTAANEQSVARMDASGQLRDYRVISFATHGLIPGDLDGLDRPALALSNPSLGQGGGEGTALADDGLLTVDEVLGLSTSADWVVLSACNTAAGDGAGAEAVSGLGRAFFYAGARALLVSHWPVHSAATRDLMVALFRRQAEDPSLPRAEAARRARLAMIDDNTFRVADGRAAFSYAHPLFWAPFTLVGDGSAD